MTDLQRIFEEAWAACERPDGSVDANDLERELVARLDGVDDADKLRKAKLIDAQAHRGSVADALNIDPIELFMEGLEQLTKTAHKGAYEKLVAEMDKLVSWDGDDEERVLEELSVRLRHAQGRKEIELVLRMADEALKFWFLTYPELVPFPELVPCIAEKFRRSGKVDVAEDFEVFAQRLLKRK